MLKIITKKEYNKLKKTQQKYDYLTGQYFTIYTGGRSKHQCLMQLSKEELVRIIFVLSNENKKLWKKLEKRQGDEI